MMYREVIVKLTVITDVYDECQNCWDQTNIPHIYWHGNID